MKKLTSILTATTLLLAAGTLGLAGCKSRDYEESGHVHRYTCPHHPEVVQSSAGTCPKCGMKLVHQE